MISLDSLACRMVSYTPWLVAWFPTLPGLLCGFLHSWLVAWFQPSVSKSNIKLHHLAMVVYCDFRTRKHWDLLRLVLALNLSNRNILTVKSFFVGATNNKKLTAHRIVLWRRHAQRNSFGEYFLVQSLFVNFFDQP